MRRYPSIPHQLPKKRRDSVVHVFDKIDGSNLRFAWDRKQGWYEWGSRTKALDESHPVFGVAWSLFQEELAEPLEALATEQSWPSLVAFVEFWGPESIGGRHGDADPKQLTLFDLAPSRRGFLGPESFLSLCGHLPVPAYLGEFVWDESLIERVLHNELEGVTFEGVVGKMGDGHKRLAVKAKTQAWKDAIQSLLSEEAALAVA